jgi:hypothetical protein
MDSDHGDGRIFIHKICPKRKRIKRKNNMNESQQKKQSKEGSFVALGILLTVLVLGFLTGILKVVGLF